MLYTKPTTPLRLQSLKKINYNAASQRNVAVHPLHVCSSTVCFEGSAREAFFLYAKSLSKQANSNNLEIDSRFDRFEYF
jgi:hypothetical protein